MESDLQSADIATPERLQQPLSKILKNLNFRPLFQIVGTVVYSGAKKYAF